MYAQGSFVKRLTPSAKRVFPCPGSPRISKVIPAGASGFLNSVPIDRSFRVRLRPTRGAEVTPSAREGVLCDLHRAVVLLDVFVRTRGRDPAPKPQRDLF